MITSLRGALVVLDAHDAAQLCIAFDKMASQLAAFGVVTSGVVKLPIDRLRAATRNASKPLPSGSQASGNGDFDAEVVGAQPDASHIGVREISSAEAARILHCTSANVRDLHRRGRLPARRVGGRWIFDARDVAALAARRRSKYAIPWE